MLNKLKEFTESLKQEVGQKALNVQEADALYAQMRKEFVQATYIAGEFAFASHFVELLKKVKAACSLDKVDRLTFSLCVGPRYNDEGYVVEVLTEYSYLKLYSGAEELTSAFVNNIFFNWTETVNISSIGRIFPAPPNLNSEQIVRVVVDDAQKLIQLLDADKIKAQDVLDCLTKLRVVVHG